MKMIITSTVSYIYIDCLGSLVKQSNFEVSTGTRRYTEFSRVGDCLSVSPTVKPSYQPTVYGSTSLQIRIQTDNWGSEAWFYVLDASDNNKNVLSRNAGSLTSNSNYQFSVPVDKSHCLEVYMKDDYGDGYCCNNGNGWYEIRMGGMYIVFTF